MSAVALAALLALGCDSDESVVGPGEALPAQSAKPPVDRLAPGELAPGRSEAFGLLLPRDVNVDARFPDAVHASGRVTPEALANYVRTRVEVAHVEIGAARTVFPRARIKGGDVARIYRIDIVPGVARTLLLVRDITPPPTVQGISEAERWRRAGMTPDGKPLNEKQLQ